MNRPNPARAALLCPILFLLAATLPASAQQYYWNTLVGEPGGLGQLDGAGSSAQFVYPQGVATDGSGNIYVADTTNNIVRKITAGGVVSTLAGTPGVSGTINGRGAIALFNAPTDLKVSAAGDIYVADSGNHAIRKINPARVVSTFAGTPGITGTIDGLATAALFNTPSSLALDSAGYVYVADTGNNTVRRVSPGGVVATIAGMPGLTGTADGAGGTARFNAPSAIAADGTGSKFFIADTGNNTVRKMTPAGVVTTFSGMPGISGSSDGAAAMARFNQPAGLAVDAAGRVFVADMGNQTLRRLSTGGLASTFAGKAAKKGSTDAKGAAARFNFPAGLAIGQGGRIFIADSGNSTIRLSDTAANISTFAGSPAVPGSIDASGTAAEFNSPHGLALDGSNNLYIADANNSVIRFVTGSGSTTTVAGVAGVSGSADGTGSNALFSHPEDVVVDGSNNVYVADTNNSVIRKIAPGGLVTTLAGMPGVTGTADGPGPAARFNKPQGLNVDGSGVVYVADTDNHTIRVVSPAGVVTTLAGTPGVSGTADGAGGAAQFDAPESLVVDGTAGVFIADTLNQTLRRISPDGSVSTFAGKAQHRGSADGRAAARFNNPGHIATDNHHDLFVADTGNNSVRKITSNGDVTTIGGTAGLYGSTPGVTGSDEFAGPQGIAATHAGALYVADTLNNRIVRGLQYLGSLSVDITPQGAIDAGADWSVDGGTPQASGAIVGALTTGTHSVSFTAIAGFDAPAGFMVSVPFNAIATATGAYIQQYGSVSVSISPSAAQLAGAAWNIDGGASYLSGVSAGNVTVGNHTINFLPAAGYDAPAAVLISVSQNQATTLTGTYSPPTGSISVTLTPPAAIGLGATWSIDNGAPLASGSTVSGLALGSHTINFSTVGGYNTPPQQMLTVFDQAVTTSTAAYVQQTGALRVDLEPSLAVAAGAMWNVDNGTFLASGTTLTGLTTGTHTVGYNNVPGWTAPPGEQVLITYGQTTAATGSFTELFGGVTVGILPARAVAKGAQWNVDGGQPQPGGATVAGLAFGSHTVNFLPAPGYTAPPGEQVIVSSTGTLATTGTYAGRPLIAVIDPNGVTLATGSATVDFGSVAAGVATQRTFEIINHGGAPLGSLAFATSGGDAARFSAGSPTSGTVATDGTATFTASVTPATFDAIGTTLQIASNDPATPVFSIALTASGTGGPVSLASGAGAYAGLIGGTGGGVRGYAAFALTPKGALTGKVAADGTLLPVKGSFNGQGQFTGGGAAMSLVLSSGSGGASDPANYFIVGNLAGVSGTASFVAWHAAYGARQPVAESRLYTVLLAGTDPSISIPQGTGYATLKVAKAGGGAVLAGKLADGSPFSFSGFITSSLSVHQFLLFDAKLYGNKGYLAGPLSFEPMATSDLDGRFVWRRPSIARTTLYSGGFTTGLDASGAQYVAPLKGNPAIPISSGTFELTGGGLPASEIAPVTLTAKDTILLTGTGINKLKVSINGPAGSFSGSFTHPVTGKTVPFSGILYQNSTSPGAAGYFIGPVVGGTSLGGGASLTK